LVLCVAKTEYNEPGVARAEGIAHKIIPPKNSSIKKNNPTKKYHTIKKQITKKLNYHPKQKNCDRDAQGLVRQRQPSVSEPEAAWAEGTAQIILIIKKSSKIQSESSPKQPGPKASP